ncbi:hypothetical protein Ancab_000541 [Ancistrocladus abbreviatus]
MAADSNTRDRSLSDSYEVLSGIIGRHSMFSTFSNYVADSLSGQKSIGDRAPVTIAAENSPAAVHQREGDVVADISIPLQSGIRGADEEAGMGFSREIFELGDGCINGSINGDKQGVSNSLLVLPDSGSTQKEIGEQVGPILMGHLLESRDHNTKQEKAHVKQAKEHKYASSDSSKSPGADCNSSQRQGQWKEAKVKERCCPQNALEHLRMPKSPQLQLAFRRNRGERKKSLQEILRSHSHGFNEGRRSQRIPRKKAITWEKLSAHTVEHEEALISSMELNDSQILNINQLLCEQDAQG